MLPSGTVTFLFTDIEGSTRLWEQYPQAMRHALARHDDLLRQGIESRGGYVFKTVGDAFCASFDVAFEALASALAIQHLLLDEDWGTTPIRVRMALHSGHADERDGDYFGPTVNRVARLLSTGHGGQVLLSGRTAELIRNNAPQTTEFRSLGSHRLKDLGNPELVFQAVEPGLQADFPVLNSLNTHPNNLPAQTTSFIGREAEVTAVAETLAQPDNRLLTLTGPGGTGKTRLSLQIAAESLNNYRDGVFFVPLGPVSDPDLVISAITQSLGVRSTGQRPPMERLKEYLADKQILLLIDNFEHVVEAAPIVSDLLAAAPGLNVLVTSRIPLQLYGERVYQVDPLSLPESASLPPTEQLAGYEAVQLFVDRAAAVKNDFALTDDNAATIAQICSRLDGLPLAIELAAARVRMFSPQLILARLNNRLQFLGGAFKDLPERQRTLRATIEWSENLLSEADRTLFRRLAVFAGGATFEAAEAVCSGIADDPEDGEPTLDVWQGLENLLDHSLLRLSEGENEPHFYMLGMIQEYAKERLQVSGEAGQISGQHAEFFLALAETAEPELRGTDQVFWLERLEREHSNLRAVLAYLLEEQETEKALQLVGSLARFWELHSHLAEGRRWLDDALAQSKGHNTGVAPSASHLAARANALHGASAIAQNQGAFSEARALGEESLELYKELENEQGQASAYHTLGLVAQALNDWDGAATLHTACMKLSEKMGDNIGLYISLYNLAEVAFAQGDHARSERMHEQSLALKEKQGDLWSISWSYFCLAKLAGIRGDWSRASQLHEESLMLRWRLKDKEAIAESLVGMASVAAETKRPQKAARLLGAAEGILMTTGSTLSPHADDLYNSSMAATQSQLEKAEFASFITEGNNMATKSFEQIVEIANE